MKTEVRLKVKEEPTEEESGEVKVYQSQLKPLRRTVVRFRIELELQTADRSTGKKIQKIWKPKKNKEKKKSRKSQPDSSQYDSLREKNGRPNEDRTGMGEPWPDSFIHLGLLIFTLPCVSSVNRLWTGNCVMTTIMMIWKLRWWALIEINADSTNQQMNNYGLACGVWTQWWEIVSLPCVLHNLRFFYVPCMEEREVYWPSFQCQHYTFYVSALAYQLEKETIITRSKVKGRPKGTLLLWFR